MHIYLGLLASIVGIWVSHYIFQKKKTKTRLVCPLRASCEKVIHSTYASHFGIANDMLGMAYYSVIGVLFAVLTVVMSVAVMHIILALSIIAALFSIYLVYVQSHILKAWCSWCLLLVLVNATVLAISLVFFI